MNNPRLKARLQTLDTKFVVDSSGQNAMNNLRLKAQLQTLDTKFVVDSSGAKGDERPTPEGATTNEGQDHILPFLFV